MTGLITNTMRKEEEQMIAGWSADELSLSGLSFGVNQANTVEGATLFSCKQPFEFSVTGVDEVIQGSAGISLASLHFLSMIMFVHETEMRGELAVSGYNAHVAKINAEIRAEEEALNEHVIDRCSSVKKNREHRDARFFGLSGLVRDFFEGEPVSENPSWQKDYTHLGRLKPFPTPYESWEAKAYNPKILWGGATFEQLHLLDNKLTIDDYIKQAEVLKAHELISREWMHIRGKIPKVHMHIGIKVLKPSDKAYELLEVQMSPRTACDDFLLYRDTTKVPKHKRGEYYRMI